MDSTAIYSHVHDRYSATARSDAAEDHVKNVAQAFGYSAEELASIPSDSNLGLSCGNPLALASLKEGETVVDLGCGAGFDVFLAAKKLGINGKAIGVDMNEVRYQLEMAFASLRETSCRSWIGCRLTNTGHARESTHECIKNPSE